MPAAMAAQNRRRSSRPATGGRPGDSNRPLPDRSDRRFRIVIATSFVMVLRQPLESAQFTSDDFTGTLERHKVTISMDGKGRYMDNIFVERLWRSLKYEEVYLNAYDSVAQAKAGIGDWLGFYNEERQHQSLGYRTPRQAYEAECRWICGRSASPTGCAFAHISTGTTTNHRIDIDEREGRSDAITVAPSAIGAGTEIGRATP
jgi:putative transposase